MRTLRTVRRTAPAVATATPGNAPVSRRIGRVSSSVVKVIDNSAMVAAKAELNEDLQSIAEYQEQLDSLVAAMEGVKDRIRTNLEFIKQPGYTDGLWSAELKSTFSRETATIDPIAFHDKVTPEVFWECIKVQVTAAKEHLAPAELVDISETKTAVRTGTVLEVKRVTNKVKKAKS